MPAILKPKRNRNQCNMTKKEKELNKRLNAVLCLILGIRVLLKMEKYFRDVKKSENNLTF